MRFGHGTLQAFGQALLTGEQDRHAEPLPYGDEGVEHRPVGQALRDGRDGGQRVMRPESRVIPVTLMSHGHGGGSRMVVDQPSQWSEPVSVRSYAGEQLPTAAGADRQCFGEIGEIRTHGPAGQPSYSCSVDGIGTIAVSDDVTKIAFQLPYPCGPRQPGGVGRQKERCPHERFGHMGGATHHGDHNGVEHRESGFSGVARRSSAPVG
ncbi:hypothetical protein BMON_0739 [Bifidobacterium mongoliense DSM 21395]|uniref:Uncharacterized protein n=1 Tax=Bifidobacterium mongoliense DSM 21395 TaxID=1437603 RepID=A0A087C0N4_9BIFI|nr:hypothetical protein BMON_0739 [Bifidobacterium mongoliense DSM 21395]